MTNVIGVRFRNVGKLYYFDPAEYEIKKDDRVIVETARGVECGHVALGVHEVEDEKIVKPLKKVLRVADDKDIAQYNANRNKEKDAFRICQKKIREHELEMKLVDVEYTFDGQKILFYFTADGRVDFRELVKDLASVFRTRIELRQIGVRDESKLLGGIGICGKPFCCSSFLFDFQPVSIKMAKEQGKSLNPAKISGVCGRLMCCLKYEQEVYEELIRMTPKNGSQVETPDGPGIVVESNLLMRTLKVRMSDKPDAMPKSFRMEEIRWSGPRQKPQPPKAAEAAPDAAELVLPEGALYTQIELPQTAPAPRTEERKRRRKTPKKDGAQNKSAQKAAGDERPKATGRKQSEEKAGPAVQEQQAGEQKAKKRRPRRRHRKPETGESARNKGNAGAELEKSAE